MTELFPPDLFTLESLLALLTLTCLEIVLGIDNIVFIVVITGRLPENQRERARRLGISLAMLTRIALLLGISWVLGLTRPLFAVLGHAVTGRDLVLLLGGAFLLGKATLEIHEKIEDARAVRDAARRAGAGLAAAVVQIMLLDVVFSLDSVITAVGMAQHLVVMIAAIVAAVGVMLVFSRAVSAFVSQHPTIQMLAFSFLLLVGVFLVAEGLGKHIDRGYIYFAMGFSLFVEFLNLRIRGKQA
ncbi:MAG: TerC family protein [Desulfovibrionaceae bacterium]